MSHPLLLGFPLVLAALALLLILNVFMAELWRRRADPLLGVFFNWISILAFALLNAAAIIVLWELLRVLITGRILDAP